MHFAEYSSPVGVLVLASDGKVLRGLRMGGKAPEQTEEDEILHRTRLWLDRYFRGENPGPDIPLAPEGTAFQQRVWQRLLEIPYGETCTYGDIAREMSGKMSAQAVGQAVGRNPIGILIPCHRVMGAGGKLTGYAWGIERKEWLLNHEAGRNHCEDC